MNAPLETIQNLVRPKEKFLMLHIGKEETSGLFLSVDEDKNLMCEKRVRNMDLKKFFSSPVRNLAQKSWEGNYFFKSRRKVAAVADPSVATTIPIPLSLTRDREIAKEDIVLSEVENLIAQGMGKIFNKCRSEAAERMDVHELETVLVGAKGRFFRVDGHLVMNPVGFKGKKISLLLELTFTTREVFEDLKQFFSAPEDFFFAELPQAWLSVASNLGKLPINFVRQDQNDSELFIYETVKDEYPILYRERFEWKFDVIFERIEHAYGMSRETAMDLYVLYLKKDGMSDSARRAFKKTIDPAVQALCNTIEKAKVKGTVYFDAPFQIPFTLPYRHAGAEFDHIPLRKALDELGFAAVENCRMTEAALSRYLFPFFAMYFDKNNSDINQKLRRRLHWLAE